MSLFLYGVYVQQTWSWSFFSITGCVYTRQHTDLNDITSRRTLHSRTIYINDNTYVFMVDIHLMVGAMWVVYRATHTQNNRAAYFIYTCLIMKGTTQRLLPWRNHLGNFASLSFHRQAWSLYFLWTVWVWKKVFIITVDWQVDLIQRLVSIDKGRYYRLSGFCFLVSLSNHRHDLNLLWTVWSWKKVFIITVAWQVELAQRLVIIDKCRNYRLNWNISIR